MKSGYRRLMVVALRQAVGTQSLQHKQACLVVAANAAKRSRRKAIQPKTAAWFYKDPDIKQVQPADSKVQAGSEQFQRTVRAPEVGIPYNFKDYNDAARKAMYQQLYEMQEDALKAEAHKADAFRQAELDAFKTGRKLDPDTWHRAAQLRGEYTPYESQYSGGKFDFSNLTPEQRDIALSQLGQELGYDPGYKPSYMQPPPKPVRDYAEIAALAKAANKPPIDVMHEEEMNMYYEDQPAAIAAALQRQKIKPGELAEPPPGIPVSRPLSDLPDIEAAPQRQKIKPGELAEPPPGIPTNRSLSDLSDEEFMRILPEIQARARQVYANTDRQSGSDFDRKMRVDRFLRGEDDRPRAAQSMPNVFDNPGLVSPHDPPPRNPYIPPEYTRTAEQRQLLRGGATNRLRPSASPTPPAAQPVAQSDPQTEQWQQFQQWQQQQFQQWQQQQQQQQQQTPSQSIIQRSQPTVPNIGQTPAPAPKPPQQPYVKPTMPPRPVFAQPTPKATPAPQMPSQAQSQSQPPKIGVPPATLPKLPPATSPKLPPLLPVPKIGVPPATLPKLSPLLPLPKIGVPTATLPKPY